MLANKHSTSKTATVNKSPKTKKRTISGGSVVQVRLRAYYPDRLDYSVRQIIDAVKRTGAVVKGPIPLPNRRSRWTLLSSPHVDKDARDQIQLEEHGRLLKVYVSSGDTMSAITQTELPPEVSFLVEVVDH